MDARTSPGTASMPNCSRWRALLRSILYAATALPAKHRSPAYGPHCISPVTRCFRHDIFVALPEAGPSVLLAPGWSAGGKPGGAVRVHRHFRAKVRRKHGAITGQYRRATGGCLPLPLPRLRHCGIEPHWRVFTRSVVRTPARRADITERTFRAMVVICLHAEPCIPQLEFMEVSMSIRKIALLLVYCAALLSQGCAMAPSGYSPMSQPSESSSYDDELSRPSGG